MKLYNNKFNVIKLMNFTLLLPLSLLLSLLIIWHSLDRAFAKDINSTPEIEGAIPMRKPNKHKVQGQPRNTETFIPSQRHSLEVISVPLGTETSIEELRRIKEGRVNTSIPECPLPKQDSATHI